MSSRIFDQRSSSFFSIATSTTITFTGLIALNYYYLTFLKTQKKSPDCSSISDTLNSFMNQKGSMWRDAGDQTNEGDQVISTDDEPEVEDEEVVRRQRDSLYDIIIPSTSPHGVPSLLKTIDAAAMFLKMARSIDNRLQNNPKIDDFFEYLTTVEQDSVRIARQGFGNLKVLVVEGLMSSGKSTLINGLQIITRASAITAVPAHLLEVKYLFSSADVPEAVVTALDYVINYCVAHKVIADSLSEPTGHIVIIEQFYHATCALSVCADVRAGVDLKTLPSSAFEWPVDLPIPHLVMFLTLKTKIRIQRQHIGRGSSLTERSSERNVTRDLRSQTAYSLITGPPTIALDASQSPEVVLGAAVEAMEEFGLYVPPKVSGPNKRMSIGLYGAFAE